MILNLAHINCMFVQFYQPLYTYQKYTVAPLK